LHTHRPADHSGTICTLLSEEIQGIAGVFGTPERCWVAWRVGPIEAPIVPTKNPISVAEVLDLMRPGLPAPSETIAEQNRPTLAHCLIGDFSAIK